MRELQILIDPGLSRRGQFVRKLAGGKHDLMIAVRKVVTVGGDREETVIQTNGLGLSEGLKQRPSVPEPDVLDRILVARDHLGREILQRGIGRLLDRVQLESLPSEIDVVREIGRLQRQFARLDDEFLEEPGEQVDADDPGRDVDACAQSQARDALAKDIERAERAGRRR